jgi:ABC-2 type transport system permease protein
VVAHLLRLKLLLLRNSIRRSPAALVGMAVGILYGGIFFLAAEVVLVLLRAGADPTPSRIATTLGGAALAGAWAVVPVMLFGVDPTLDPARFATLAVPERTLATGLAASALVGLPGAATVALAVTTLVTWSRSPSAVVFAAVGAACGLATCALLSRIVTGLLSASLQTRRARDTVAALGVGALLVLVPGVALGASRTIVTAHLEGIAGVVGWTPLGWAWAAPADAAERRFDAGVPRIALALGLVAVLGLVWRQVLRRAMEAPPASSGGSGPGGLGLLGRLPATAAGAIAARALTYWRRDPRFNFPGFMTAVVPLGLVFAWHSTGSARLLAVMPVTSAYLIGWGPHNDVGYDSTAFWMHLSAGVDGLSDRLGRLAPSAALAAVCVPGYALLGASLSGDWSLLPATLGAASGVLLAGLAVASVASAVLPYPTPKPGEGPFATRPGGAGLTVAVQTVCAMAVLLLSLPVLVLGLLAERGSAWAAWSALVVGPLVGSAALAAGLVVGGRVLERRGPELLQRLGAMR